MFDRVAYYLLTLVLLLFIALGFANVTDRLDHLIRIEGGQFLIDHPPA